MMTKFNSSLFHKKSKGYRHFVIVKEIPEETSNVKLFQETIA